MEIYIDNRFSMYGISEKSSYEEVLRGAIDESMKLIQDCNKELNRLSSDKNNACINSCLSQEIANCVVMLSQLQAKVDLKDEKLNQLISKKCGMFYQKRREEFYKSILT